LAGALVELGFTSLEEVAYVPAETFHEIEGLDDETIALLQTRAKDAAIADELLQQESIQDPSEELLALEGLDRELAFTLAANGIVTVDDLADQAVGDLEDLGVDTAIAGKLIMKARESWFI
jgi:N utilization substance protein A